MDAFKTIYLFSREQIKALLTGAMAELPGAQQIGCADPITPREARQPKLLTKQFPCSHCERSFKSLQGKGVHEARAHKK